MAARTWLVRKSRFPFHALGEPLGTVVARDFESATAVASATRDEHGKLRFPRPFTIEPAPRAPLTATDDVLEREIPMRGQRRKPAINNQFGAIGIGVKTP